MSPASAEVVVNPKFIWIIVVSDNFLSRVVKLIKMFLLKLLEIDLNTVPKTVVFDVCDSVLIKLMYCILVKNIMVSRLNFYAIVKKDF